MALASIALMHRATHLLTFKTAVITLKYEEEFLLPK